MIAWILLILLLVFPWVAPTIERACSRYAGYPDGPYGGGQWASEDEILEAEMQTTGHLQ